MYTLTKSCLPVALLPHSINGHCKQNCDSFAEKTFSAKELSSKDQIVLWRLAKLWQDKL